MVASIIGWALLGLFILLLLILLVPVTVQIKYSQAQLSVKLRVLFLFFTIFPFKDKPEKASKTNKKKKRTKKEPKPKQKAAPVKEKTLEDKLGLIKKLATAALEALGFFIRFLHIHAFSLVVYVQTQDAAQTAILYGRLQAVMGGLHALLANNFHITFKRMQLFPDFAAQQHDTLLFSCNLSVPPVIILIAAIKGFFSFLKPTHTNNPKAAPTGKASGVKRSDTNGQQ